MSLIMLEGFEDLTAWGLGGSPVLAAGRNGNCMFMNGNVYAVTNIPTALQTNILMVGVAVKSGSMGIAVNFLQFMSDAAVTSHITVAMLINGSIQLGTGGSVRYTSPPGTLTVGTWYYVEVQATLHDTTGTAALRLNGNLLSSLTGIDTKTGGTKTVFDSIYLRSDSGDSFYFDDLYATNSLDTFWGDIAVETLYPDGMDTTAWVGSDGDAVNNHLLVNEAGTPVDTTYTQSSTVAAREVYTCQNMLRTTGSVLGVQVNARANKSDSGARGMKVVAKEGGVTKSVYTTQTPDSGGQSVQQCIGADFTFAENGNLVGFRFYRDSGTATTSRTIKAWTTGGTWLAGVVTTGETGGGWTTAMLPTPLAITSGTTIRVGEDTGGSWYRFAASGPSTIVNGTLTRGTTWAGSAGNLPTTNALPNDYFVDVIFQPGSGAVRSTADTALTTTFTDYPLPLEKKNDGTAWTVADVNALGIGVEVSS